MSDLGAIFHVKKDGVQYDAHAYTTLDECPYPNLKIKFNGSAAYIKMEAKGSGDVPCYAKGAEGVYQVKKEAGPPTGQTIIEGEGTFTVPSGIHVIELYGDFNTIYLGVTPNTTHHIYIDIAQKGHVRFYISVGCTSHNRVYTSESFIAGDGEEPSANIRISWSPEINKISPTVTDY